MQHLLDPNNWLALITLIFLEIVLGVDNLVVLAITSSRLPANQQQGARQLGLALALIFRLVLLALASWIASLTKPLFIVFTLSVSGRDILFVVGGFFLILKGAKEIYHFVWNKEENSTKQQHSPSQYLSVIAQIAFFDMVFSLDSIITAVGMTDHYIIMAIAITAAILVMLLASEPLCHFINKKPRVKILALTFILLIGIILVLDGIHLEVSRSYIYVVIVFSIFVEFLNSSFEKYISHSRAK